MSRPLLFGLISAASVLTLLIIAEVRTRYAQDLIFGADVPCEERSWEEENEELTRAEAYVSMSDDGGRITFVLDETSARAAGISDEALELLKETLAYQDALLEESRRSGVLDITLLDVDVEDYPKVKAFMDRTNAYHDSRERSRGASLQADAGVSSVPQCAN